MMNGTSVSKVQERQDTDHQLLESPRGRGQHQWRIHRMRRVAPSSSYHLIDTCIYEVRPEMDTILLGVYMVTHQVQRYGGSLHGRFEIEFAYIERDTTGNNVNKYNSKDQLERTKSEEYANKIRKESVG